MVKKQKKTNLEKEKNSVVDSKSINQFLWLVGFIIVLILAIIFVPKIYHQIFDKFEYGGVNFERTKSGSLEVFHGQFPIIYKGNLTAIFNVYFRTDPRKNNIPINTNISFSKEVAVTFGDDVQYCKDLMLAQISFTQFIKAFPFVKNMSSGAVTNETAKLYNISQFDCKNASSDRAVIIIQKSENTSIVSGDRNNCFVLNVGDCKYLETTERFIMGAMAQVNGKTI